MADPTRSPDPKRPDDTGRSSDPDRAGRKTAPIPTHSRLRWVIIVALVVFVLIVTGWMFGITDRSPEPTLGEPAGVGTAVDPEEPAPVVPAEEVPMEQTPPDVPADPEQAPPPDDADPADPAEPQPEP